MVIPFMTVYLTYHLHYSIAQAGWVMAAYGTGSIIGAFAGGRIADKIGFYPVQFWSLFFNGTMFIVLGQISDLWHIGICIFIMSSVGESFRPANAAAIAAYSDDTNRTRSYSLNRLAVNLGFSIGPALGGILSSISFQLLFWVDGITCILAAILLRIFLKPMKNQMPHAAKKIKVPKQESVFHDKIYLRFMACVFMVAFSFLMIFSMVPIYFKDQMHLNESFIGMILGMNGLIIALVEMILVYKIEGRRLMTTYISAGAFCIGLAYLSLNFGTAASIAIISMLIITLGEMLMFPFVNTFWVTRSKEHNRAQYASIYTISFSTAQVLSPTIGAQIINHFGYHALWFTITGICTLASLFFYRFGKMQFE